MMTFAEYLDSNRESMAVALRETGRDGPGQADYGRMLALAMHRVGKVSYALLVWGGKKGVPNAPSREALRAEVLNCAAHATVLLEQVAQRVEELVVPQDGGEDKEGLCYVTARAHECTGGHDCPSCNAARRLAMLQAPEAVASPVRVSPEKMN